MTTPAEIEAHLQRWDMARVQPDMVPLWVEYSHVLLDALARVAAERDEAQHDLGESRADFTRCIGDLRKSEAAAEDLRQKVREWQEAHREWGIGLPFDKRAERAMAADAALLALDVTEPR